MSNDVEYHIMIYHIALAKTQEMDLRYNQNTGHKIYFDAKKRTLPICNHTSWLTARKEEVTLLM